MGLAKGTRLGPYEIDSALGAGGMGEVYRARDTRLERTVAIKVLPSHLSHNPDLKQRFEREARAISSLNHPHICTLHDVGSQDGVDFLVMECLEGETLAARLTRGPLKIDEAVRIAIEIAGALDKAHAQGIIHRDLKPGNVMLTKAGAKLMDFGLAKPAAMGAMAGSGSAPLLSAAMTMTSPSPQYSPLTSAGMLVGTVQYMSPEQLQGVEADARSDIFALGAVLYEMIAGRRAFEGKSQLSVATAILEREIESLSPSQPGLPPVLEHVVRTCLAKDPAGRYQSALDVKLDLAWVAETPAAESAAPRGMRSRVAGIVAVAAVLVAAALAGILLFRSKTSVPVLRASIVAPAGTTFAFTGDFSGPPVLSPDGSKLVFQVQNSSGKKQLWVRPLNEQNGHALENTEGAIFPFWSPDSRYIAFFQDGKLKKESANGGPASTLADAQNGRGGAWGSKGVILFAPDFRGPLKAVSESGGAVSEATHLDPALHTTHRWPVFLPDGKHFLYFANNHAGGQRDKNGIYEAELGSPAAQEVIASDAGPIFASGYLLYLADGGLVAQRLDPAAAKLTGDPVRLLESVVSDVSVWRMVATTSETGMLAYRTTGGGAGLELTWYDRTGKSLGRVGERSYYADPRLSPDGRTLAVVEGGVGSLQDIYLFDLVRGVKTRFTFDGNNHASPAWSADGKNIIYAAAPVGAQSGWSIYSKQVNGGTASELLVPTGKGKGSPQLTPDGRYVLYQEQPGPTHGSIKAMPLQGDRTPSEIITPQSPNGNIGQFRLSPDGKWIAFECDDDGQLEIYVSPFPGNGRIQVTSGGGVFPDWRGDGQELYYVDTRTAMLDAVPITTKGNQFQFGTPQPLFRFDASAVGDFVYDVTRDGKKFVMNTVPASTDVPLSLLTNWMETLKH